MVYSTKQGRNEALKRLIASFLVRYEAHFYDTDYTEGVRICLM